MKTRLRILNIILLLACGFTVWQMRANQVEASARQDRVFANRAKPAAQNEVQIEPIPAAAVPSTYSEVAMRMLFAQDRNPNVVEEKKPEPEPKKMPPLPVFHGVINFGDGPVAMLSPDGSTKQGSYKEGDSIGEFKIVKITKEKLTFNWDGQEIVKTAEQLKAEAAPAKKPAAAKAKPAPVAQNTPPPPPAKAGPGKETGGRERACQPGENAPDGTVVDGWVKRTTYSPMGAVCYWEPVSK
jgi:hypothetical protein